MMPDSNMRYVPRVLNNVKPPSCKGGDSMICSCPTFFTSELEVFDAESRERAHSPFVGTSHRYRCADCGSLRATGRPEHRTTGLRAAAVDGAATRARASGR